MVGASGPEPFKGRTPFPRPIQRKLAVTCSRLGDMEADLNVPEVTGLKRPRKHHTGPPQYSFQTPRG